jgi:hypothetical protein
MHLLGADKTVANDFKGIYRSLSFWLTNRNRICETSKAGGEAECCQRTQENPHDEKGKRKRDGGEKECE